MVLLALQAKLEIEVRAHVHSKTLVVEEAKRLNARYVVIDRYSSIQEVTRFLFAPRVILK